MPGWGQSWQKRRKPAHRRGNSHATMPDRLLKRQLLNVLHPENAWPLGRQNRYDFGHIPVLHRAGSGTSARAGYFFTPENKKLRHRLYHATSGYTCPRQQCRHVPGADAVPWRVFPGGYELDSIGLVYRTDRSCPNAPSLAGSLNTNPPFTRTLSGAVFHDIRRCRRQFQTYEAETRFGTGRALFSARLRCFLSDIAYGHSDKKIRWHISLGTRLNRYLPLQTALQQTILKQTLRPIPHRQMSIRPKTARANAVWIPPQFFVYTKTPPAAEAVGGTAVCPDFGSMFLGSNT